MRGDSSERSTLASVRALLGLSSGADAVHRHT
jgi:hypothetical protein